MSKIRTLPSSFKYAGNGIKIALKNEPNFQIHVVVGFLAIVAGVVLGLTLTQWVVLFFTIFFVLIMELINTAIEAIVDLVSPDYHPKAKVAKDVAAAAVLLSACSAVGVGIVLFLPRIANLIAVI